MITDKVKVEMYEAVLHAIHYCHSVEPNKKRLSELLINVSVWSKAQYRGDEKEQEVAFWELMG